MEYPGVELMPHQKAVLPALSSGQVLYGATGDGKGITALAYYMEKEAPRDIVVITTAKKRDALDWHREAAMFGLGSERGISRGGTLVVDSWNNIGRYEDREDHFFIFDEQRLVGSGAWVKSFLKIAKRNRWILLSATPGDTWLDYAPIFIANGFYRNITEFKAEHVIYAPYLNFPKVVRYVGEEKLQKLRARVLVEMPYRKHTERFMNYLDVSYDKDLWDTVVKKRWSPFTDKPIMNVSELFWTMRKVVNSDPSRLDQVRMLMKAHPKLIVFYNFNYELDILRTLADEVTVAEWNGKKKQPIPTTDRWVYLVQYTAGAEGWNCTETDAMILYSLTYSYKAFMQALGRIDRLDTKYTKLYYYIFVSSSPICRAVKKALGRKKNFNKAELLEMYEFPAIDGSAPVGTTDERQVDEQGKQPEYGI